MIMTAEKPKANGAAAPKRFSATEKELATAQLNFDFLMPFKKATLNTQEVGQVIGFGDDYVRKLIEDGRLEAHADSAFGTRPTYRVTRRSILVYFARTAQYDPAQFLDGFKDLLRSLTSEQLTKLIVMTTHERANR